MRAIKFRAWAHERKTMLEPVNLLTNFEGWVPNGYPANETFRLMQFTGLLDKNGKEIYEGDILLIDNSFKLWKLPDSGIVEVKWIGAGFYPLCNDLTQVDKSEIIGNIYENPELLKC